MQITIPIPTAGECLLKEEQEVTFDTPFIKAQKQVQMAIPIAQKLHIDSSKIFRYLKKFVGESISIDEIIASKKGLLGTKKIRSPFEGIIKEIDHVKGELLVQTHSADKDTIPCWFHGQVVKVEDTSVTIKVHKGAHFDLKSANESFGGALYVYDPSNTSFAEVDGKIVLAETISAYEQTKFEAMGAKGFVTLKNLEDKSFVPTAILKHIDDFEKIKKALHPYCVIDHTSSTMYVYE